jgi:anti-sigma regulatory factor (Ser/Thr protein kinase)
MEPRIDLDLTAEPSEARRLRDELRRWLTQAGINGSTGHDITLSAVEAFTNSVKHPVDRATPEIHVHGHIAADAVTVAVEDDGHWRRPDRTRDSGGFGLALMKSFMTSVHIDRAEHGTRVVLRRTLSRDANVPELQH